MSDLKTAGAFGGIAIGLVVLIFGISWAILHGVMELGQLAGIYDWEPTFWASLFAMFVYNMLARLFSR